MEYLSNFHKEYILVPADKATNNVIIICKKYYLEVILKELDRNVSNTYTHCNIDTNSIVNEHLKMNKIKVPMELHKLPSLYTGYLSCIKTHMETDLL